MVRVAMYSVVEEQNTKEATNNENNASEDAQNPENQENNDQNSENNENQENKKEPVSDEQKKKNYNDAKNNIFRRLTAMKSDEFDIRLNEDTGKLVIEVPSTVESSYLSEIVSKGKVEIKNTTSNEVIVDSNVFTNAEAVFDKNSYEKALIKLNLEFSKDAKKKITEANIQSTDDDGSQTDVKFALTVDNETLYTDSASTFVSSAEKGKLELVMGQSDEGEALEQDYQRALAITAIIKCGEIPVEYEIDSLDLVSSNINIKAIVITAVVIAVLMFVFAVFKFKLKAILPTLSIIGLIATVLLVLRYTNVKITLFTVLGLAVIALINYIVVLKTLQNDKSFKDNLMSAINVLTPCIIMAIVFCCSPFLQLASFGMAIFWGLIVTCVYDMLITRVLIEK